MAQTTNITKSMRQHEEFTVVQTRSKPRGGGWVIQRATYRAGECTKQKETFTAVFKTTSNNPHIVAPF